MATNGSWDVLMDGKPAVIGKHSPVVENALGEAAARMAIGFSRPALVPLRVAMIAASVQFLCLAIGFWFLLFAMNTEFSAIPAIFYAGGLSLFGVAVGVALKSFSFSNLTNKNGIVKYALIAVYVPVVPIVLFFPSDLGIVARFLDTVVLFVGVALPMRWLFQRLCAWAVSTGLTARRAVIAGGGEEAARVVRGLSVRKNNDVSVCALFDDRNRGRVPDLLYEVPKIGKFEDLTAFCQIAEIDLIIVTLPLSAEERISKLVEQLKVLPVAVHLSEVSHDLSFPDTRDAGILPGSFGVERRLTKRAFDIIVGACALVMFSPIMVAAAIAVKVTSPGPLFFRQERHGYNNRVVNVWKFRSMFHDQCDHAAAKIVTKGDPRVTPVGRFLRKSSIDELPQLFNVLEGTLSLVGPRAHAVYAQTSGEESFSGLIRDYSARHRLPPGITGLAQINGRRGEISAPEQLRARVQDDLWYIENWSFWLDLWILIKTPIALLDTRNAY